MSKTIELCKVRPGETFALDGVDFVKLADDQGAVFALTRDVALKNVQFENGDKDRDCHNNFINSDLCCAIYRWISSEHEAIFNAVTIRYIDLTTMDGMTDYGYQTTVVRALTIDEYRKYRRLIPLASKPYWLATGWTTKSSPRSKTSDAYSVSTDGTVTDNCVFCDYYAARPALYLIPSVLVSVEWKASGHIRFQSPYRREEMEINKLIAELHGNRFDYITDSNFSAEKATSDGESAATAIEQLRTENAAKDAEIERLKALTNDVSTPEDCKGGNRP